MMRRSPDGTFTLVHKKDIETVQVKQMNTVWEDNAAFLRCIRGEMDWRSHAQLERSVLALAIAAQRSADQDRQIMLQQ
jgi:hypothetical protein